MIGYTESTPGTQMFGFKSKPRDETPAGKDQFFSRLQKGLQRTRAILLTDIGDLVQGIQPIDQAFLDNLEEHLLQADVGVNVTTEILKKLTARKTDANTNAQEALRAVLGEILNPVNQPLHIPESGNKPFVILVTGVNGAGKTTSIGKLAHHYIKEGKTVMLAAGDTFRAAAIEQLQTWGTRNNVPVIAQNPGSDSAAVIFDALQSARSRNVDILIADTAGRLHTQGNLMDELKKIRRVINRFDADLTPECLLVLDAGTGQNALQQTKQFNAAVGVTGIVLTKLDGTAKGGIIFALARETGIPIRYIGVGEGVEDLQVFNSDDFLNALFDTTK